MPRDYQNDVDWVGSWPVEISALTALGKMGYRCSQAAQYCRSVMDYVRTKKGLVPTENAFKCRLDHKDRYGKEAENLQKKKPVEFQKGHAWALEIQKHFLFIGLAPNLKKVKSPAESEHLSTESNRIKREADNLNRKIKRTRGDTRVVPG